MKPNTGSFRDPANKVYEVKKASKAGHEEVKIYRGVNESVLADFRKLTKEAFFIELQEKRALVRTQECEDKKTASAVKAEGWAGVLEHETVPFVSYPYEWTFGMLKDAAVLHLEIIQKSLEAGWTLKDATPFNIQFVNSRPIFIDIPSFERREPGAPWLGYRQFCSMFLTPLMLRAHLGINHLPLLRSYIDGIPATEAVKFFRGKVRFKKGVMSHIFLPAKVENSIAGRERDGAVAQKREHRKHSDAMVLGLVDSLIRLVKKLNVNIEHTDWSQYDKTHSYKDIELDEKKEFVAKHVGSKPRHHVWDVGCNTGTFSKIAEQYADMVLSLDGDHDAVQQLYARETVSEQSSILPMVMDLSNISPNHGWAGVERLALDNRVKPDLVMCLALIHHTRISANIPNVLFLKWLRSLEASVIIEFVNRDDEMVIKLLTNKKEQYDDYNIDQFVTECGMFFKITDRQILKGGKREIFYLEPK